MASLTTRERVGLSMAPVLLRLVLGVTFVWTGLGKIIGTFEAAPEQLAVLANMGAIDPPGTGGTPARPPAKDANPADQFTKPDGETKPAAPASTTPKVEPVEQGRYAASDFAGPQRVRGMYHIALLIAAQGNPPRDASGSSLIPLWPAKMAQGQWPLWLARGVAAAELGFGALVLIGFLTRLSALGLVGVMLGAMWLTQIGPAIQSGNTTLGFLPAAPNGEWWDVKTYSALLWQAALAGAALALFLLGSGTLAIDRFVFGGARDDDE